MADWTTLDTNGLLPGEPVTSEKVLAFYNNPIAIAEGASGAPVIFTKALEQLPVYHGSASGVVEDTTLISQTALDDFGTLHLSLSGDNAGAADYQFEIRLSANNGSTWSAWTDIINVDESSHWQGYIDLVTGKVTGQGVDGVSAAFLDTTILANANAVQVRIDISGSAVATGAATMVPLCGRG